MHLSPARRVSLIVGAALIAAGLIVGAARGNAGPLLILGTAGAFLLRPP